MESSFQTAICECPDINATTMAVDATGRYAMVSGRKSMGLINLDESGQNTSVDQPDRGGSTQKIATVTPRLTPVCKKMLRNSKYDPTASQFSHCLSDLFALTSYQVVEIFSIDDLNPSKPKFTLRGHSRTISDIDWSPSEPHLIGSSAADCLTNLWDIRDSRRPIACLTSVTGATQVRFSKTSNNLLATSHEIDVRIWDIRQPNLPLYYLAAHLQKINGMDWNPNRNNCDHEQLITCSQDNTIKLWDLNANKIRPSATLPTRTPAWRVRYTSVSPYALMSSTLPQLRSRSECMTLKLWFIKPSRYEQKLELILNLVGHTDVIVDFDWRKSAASGASEVVSWSKDQTLRLWRIDNQFIEMNVDNSDFETECDASDNVCESTELKLLSNDGQPRNSISRSPETPLRKRQDAASNEQLSQNVSQKITDQDTSLLTIESSLSNELENRLDLNLAEDLPTTNELKQEFNLINKNIPNIEFEELNSLRRVCLVTARAKSITCRLRIALPLNYPHNECPTFTIIDSNQPVCENLTKEAKDKLLTLLNETAKSQLSRSRNCIEPCLRKFIAALQKLTSHSSHRSRRTAGTSTDYKDDPITLSAQRDHSVPFPPISGARFCGNLLVCFGRPMIPTINTSSEAGDSTNWLVETPRSMAQLSAQLDNMRRQGSYNLSNISISHFYYGAMKRVELQNRTAKSSSSSRRTSSKYLPNRNKSSVNSQSILSKSYRCGPVVVYDVSNLLGGLCRDLAENYVFDKDVMKMCRKNAQIAATYNRRDLVQIWSLAELSSEGVLRSYMPNRDDENSFSLVNNDSDFGDRPWTMHPFGSKLIQSLIDHYVHNCQDVQTAAMLVWTFSSPKLGRSFRLRDCKSTSSENQVDGKTTTSKQCVHPECVFSSCHKPKRMNTLIDSLVSNYQTVVPGMLSNASISKQQREQQQSIANADAISDEWSFVNGPETHLYSNSWSNSTNNGNLIDSHSNSDMTTNKHFKLTDDTVLNHLEDRFPRLNILSPEKGLQNDLIMHIYAELLYRLNLLNQRAMVLKNIGSDSAYSGLFGDKQTSNDEPEERLPNLTVQCYNVNCHNNCHSVQCPSCKKFSLYCSICRLPVKGSSSVCIKCLHGGHINHFSTWFESYDFCPAGCGCKCLLNVDE